MIRDGLRRSSLVALALGTMLWVGCDDDDTSTGVTPQPGAAVIHEDITSDRTLHSDTVYTLQGFIHVANGATLTIEPGTRIVGDFETVGSSLFILRGARIEANGTANAPIVFTSERPEGQRQAGDWGGLILVGNGIINRGEPVILEGTGTGGSNPAVDYSGGTDNGDDSGVLRYVRIEWAGYATAPDAELNGLTMAAVGSGTTIEYVQVFNGLDDSFEWFGGAVDGRYLVSYESGDDHFDASEGYVGRNQFLIGYQSKRVIPRPAAGNPSNDPQGIENDGCAGANCLDGQNSEPFTVPIFANFTLVGPPAAVVDGTSGGIGMMLRRGTGGYYVNGVVANWSRALISLRDSTTIVRRNDGDLLVRNLLLQRPADLSVPLFQPQTGTTVQDTFALDAPNNLEDYQDTPESLFVLLPVDPGDATHFDWAPSGGSAAATGGLTSFSGDAQLQSQAGAFVVPTSYRGAVDPDGARWWEGWTIYEDS